MSPFQGLSLKNHFKTIKIPNEKEIERLQQQPRQLSPREIVFPERIKTPPSILIQKQIF